MSLSHGTLQSTKVWQYHRPIARPIFFWLNAGSLMSPGGLCHALSAHLLRRMSYNDAIVGFNQRVSETNKYGGRSHGNH